MGSHQDWDHWNDVASGNPLRVTSGNPEDLAAGGEACSTSGLTDRTAEVYSRAHMHMHANDMAMPQKAAAALERLRDAAQAVHVTAGMYLAGDLETEALDRATASWRLAIREVRDAGGA